MIRIPTAQLDGHRGTLQRARVGCALALALGLTGPEAFGWTSPGPVAVAQAPPAQRNDTESKTADKSPDGFIIVEGQVTDHAGVGQADVNVTVRHRVEGNGEGDVIGTAATDIFGDFRVTAPKRPGGDLIVTFTRTRPSPIPSCPTIATRCLDTARSRRFST